MSSVTENGFVFKISSRLLKTGVPDSVIRVLSALECHRNKRTGQCNPAQQTLASELGLGHRTVKRAIAWLSEAGLLTIKRNGRTSACYKLAPAANWIPLLSRGQNGPSKGSPMGQNGPSKGAKMAHRQGPKWPIEGSVSINESKKGNLIKESGSACTNGRERSITTSTSHTHPPRREKTTAEAQSCEKTTAEETTAIADSVTAKLIEKHPRPGQPSKARAIIRRLYLGADDLRDLTERIGRSHRAWRAYWANHPDRVQPLLWQWFDSGDWESPPTEDQQRKPASRHEPEWCERVRRSVAAAKEAQ